MSEEGHPVTVWTPAFTTDGGEPVRIEAVVLDYEEPMRFQSAVEPARIFDPIDPHGIVRRLVRAEVREQWGMDVTDAEIQDEALDELLREAGCR